MRNPRRRFVMVAAALTVAATMTPGCAATPKEADPRTIVLEAAEELRLAGARENAEALEDGELTEDEHMEAARRYQSCMRAAGIVLEGPYANPADNVQLLWGLPDSVAGGERVTSAADACAAQWGPVAAAYIDTRPQRMDLPLRDAVAACLTDRGHAPTGEERSVVDFIGDASTASTALRTDVEECVTERQMALYPELPGVVVAY